MTQFNGLNAAELAQAQRSYQRRTGWFWFFILCIPLGVVLPCLLSAVSYRIWGNKVSAPVALSAFLWPLVGIAGSLLLRGGRRRARRAIELAQLGDSVGLKYTRAPARDSYEYLKTVSVMENPHHQYATNMLIGTAGGRTLQALDYDYSYHWGSVTEYAQQTLVVFPAGFERVPPFFVVPNTLTSKLENMILGNRGRIPFPNVPQFSSDFSVVGDHAPSAVACVTPLIPLFLQDRLLTVFVDQGRLLVFRRLTYLPADQYRAFLATAFHIAEVLDALQ